MRGSFLDRSAILQLIPHLEIKDLERLESYVFAAMAPLDLQGDATPESVLRRLKLFGDEKGMVVPGSAAGQHDRSGTREIEASRR